MAWIKDGEHISAKYMGEFVSEPVDRVLIDSEELVEYITNDSWYDDQFEMSE